VPGNIHIASYYQGGPQHDATGALGWWNRLFSGQMQGIEHDLILVNTTAESVGGQWQAEGGCHGKCFDMWKASVYLKAMVASMQMTDELIHSEPCQCREPTGECSAYSFNSYQSGCVRNQRFRNGGNGTHWPYGGGWILCIPSLEHGDFDRNVGLTENFLASSIRTMSRNEFIHLVASRYNKGYPYANGSVFLPAVLPPAAGFDAAKDAPTSLSANRVRVFSPEGGDEHWLLPLSWVGKAISARAIAIEGSVTPPTIVVTGRDLLIKGMAAGVPVVLTVAEEV
jgi:hypothetical protein